MGASDKPFQIRSNLEKANSAFVFAAPSNEDAFDAAVVFLSSFEYLANLRIELIPSVPALRTNPVTKTSVGPEAATPRALSTRNGLTKPARSKPAARDRIPRIVFLYF